MTFSTFYSLYAGTPLDERVTSIEELDGRSLHTVYQQIKGLEDSIRPTQVTIDNLLSRVQNYWIKTGKI